MSLQFVNLQMYAIFQDIVDVCVFKRNVYVIVIKAIDIVTWNHSM